jgi:GntR family transcriptional regulator, transcriptional repressor for pyruvate dehydrogenase complex
MFVLAKLTPLKRKSQRVAENLLDGVRRGELEAGGKLPSERELAEAMEVSRTVVREALTSLQLAGIVERHVGDGTYVRRDLDLVRLNARLLVDDVDAGVNIVEAIEARHALDHAVTMLALENSRPTDIEAIQSIIRQMRTSLDNNQVRDYLELTLQFHIAVARAGGNSVLERLVAELIEMVRPHVWLIERNYTDAVGEESFRIHKAMADGIERKDEEMALAAVHEHYRKYPSLQK